MSESAGGTEGTFTWIAIANQGSDGVMCFLAFLIWKEETTGCDLREMVFRRRGEK